MSRVRKNTSRTESKHWKIGIYIRLSREDKEGENAMLKRSRQCSTPNVEADASGSVIEQDKMLTEWVAEYFGDEKYEIFDYFVDDGLSGTDDTRDEFQRLIKCAEDGIVNCMVVKTLSRAFRNYSDQGRYLEEIFPRLGLRFIATGNPFVDSYNNPDAISGMEIPINGLLNDRIAAKTSADIRRTFDAKRRRGEFIGAFAPYGYLKDPEDKNHLIIDPEAAECIQSIFQWFVVDGASKRGIARKLNALRVLNPTAYKQRVQKLNYKNPNSAKNDGLWNEKKVSEILQDEMYIGTMVQGKQRIISYKVHEKEKPHPSEWYVVTGMHEAIIDMDLFEKAQLLHSRDTRTAPGKSESHLFAGLLRCPDCGKAMRRKTAKNLAYFHCRTVIDKGKDACVKRSIREDKLQKAVLDAIRMQIVLAESLNEAVEAINRIPIVKTQSNRLNNSLKLRQAELSKTLAIYDGLYLDWKNGEISNEDYQRRKTSYGEEVETLKVSVANIHDEIATMANGVNAADPYLTAFLKHQNISKLNRGILTELIHTIYVHKDGQITIDFLFEDELKRVLDFIENNRNDMIMADNKAVS